MKHLFSLIAVSLLNFSAYSQFYSWAKSIDGNERDFGNSVVSDHSGNVYTTGIFWENIDADPGNETFMLNSVGEDDIFLTKFDASGNFIWAKSIGTIQSESSPEIALDPLGNIVLLGNSYVIGSRNSTFLMKFTPEGSLKWKKVLGAQANHQSLSVSCGTNSQIVVTGYFSSTLDFDPGPAVFNLTSKGKEDIFVLQLNSDGNFIGAQHFGGRDQDLGYSLKLDEMDNIYLTGSFNDTIFINRGASTYKIPYLGNTSVLILKLDNKGEFLWASRIGNFNTSKGLDITFDSDKNVYTTGFFSYYADFDPDGKHFFLQTKGNWDGFICKHDPMGKFLWARQIGSYGDEQSYTIAVDKKGTVYSSGNFKGTIDVNPSETEVFELESELYNSYLLALDNEGVFKWAKKIEGTSGSQINSLCVSPNGALCLTGSYIGNAKFPTAKDTIYCHSKDQAIVVATLNQVVNGLKEIENPEASLINISPTPASTHITLSVNNEFLGAHFEISELQGKKLISGKVEELRQTIDLTGLPSGAFILQMEGYSTMLKVFKF